MVFLEANGADFSHVTPHLYHLQENNVQKISCPNIMLVFAARDEISGAKLVLMSYQPYNLLAPLIEFGKRGVCGNLL